MHGRGKFTWQGTQFELAARKVFFVAGISAMDESLE
jgi:hypothetical protein